MARAEEIKRQEQKRASKIRTSPVEETPIGGIVHSLSTREISVNFVDTDLKDVIRVFAKRTNKNILLKTGVSGKVNLRLEKVPLDEAFWTILNENELVAVRESENVIRVLPRDQAPTTRAYFVLKNRKPEEVTSSVQQAFGKDASLNIVVDSGSNNVIVTATPDVIEKVSEMIERLDIKARQIKITSRVMEVSKTDKSDVGIRLDVSEGNAIPFTIGNTGLEVSGGIHSQWAAEVAGYKLLQIAAILDPGQLDAIFGLYAEKHGVSILNHPSVVVQNDEEANIHIGEDVPYLTYLVTETGTEQKMQTVQVGTILNVTPSCNPGSDLIQLDLKVEVSELLGVEAAGPHTTTRNASTVVSVTDKQSIIIGGLVRNREEQVIKKVPILGDIPLIRLLFRNKYTETVRTELFIVITPELVG
jgi:type II secretory pathway component GspD/PulD (secretin)